MNTNGRRMKRQMRDHNQTICVSNATNSRSPNDLKSRIFIGNLNTSVITKRHLHLIFIQFGEIKAISMHKEKLKQNQKIIPRLKGYAFIQYDDQMDAINAVLTQDGQMLAGQAIDVNLVTEPKPHQKSSKTSTVSNGSETSGDINTETENNSLENCVEIDINYTNFENTINEMIVECDSVHSDRHHSHEKCRSDTNNEQNSVQISEVQSNSKRVKLDITPELVSETTLDNSNDISSETNKSGENSFQCSIDESRSDSKRSDSTYAEPNINRHLINSLENNYCFQSEQNPSLSSSFTSLLTNPALSLLLNSNNNNNNSQRSSTQESVPLALSQIQQQSYDILICGNCRTFFTSLPLFIQHKRSSKCRLRFVCRCQPK